VIARAADIPGDPHKYRPDSQETADHSLPYLHGKSFAFPQLSPAARELIVAGGAENLSLPGSRGRGWNTTNRTGSSGAWCLRCGAMKAPLTPQRCRQQLLRRGRTAPALVFDSNREAATGA
jgi:hypothetical protein